MISYGYCYVHGVTGGYKQMGIVDTEKEAMQAIEKKLAGNVVTFETNEGKTRAFADGASTNYIYFSVKAEQWALLDISRMVVVCCGSLEAMKKKVRQKIDKAHKDNYCDPVQRMVVSGRGKIRTIHIRYADTPKGDSVPTEYELHKIS